MSDNDDAAQKSRINIHNVYIIQGLINSIMLGGLTNGCGGNDPWKVGDMNICR